MITSRTLFISLLSCVVLCSLPNVTQAQTLPANFSSSLTAAGSFNQPVGVTWDANGRQYVWEKGGKVWIVSNGTRLPSPMVDIGPEVGNWRDHGMLGFALDPDFLSNGRIYMMYTVDRHYLMNFGTGSYSASTNEYYAATIMRIVRYTATDPGFTSVDPNSRFILLGETRQTGAALLHESHSTGSLVFGADGTLMATIGDAASYNTVDVGSDGPTYYATALAEGILRPEENIGAFRAQLLNCHNGKLLRLDPNTGNGVPSNPYYDASAPRSPKSRVWALGLRNPFRMTKKPNSGSTDPADGNPGVFYIGDVGWGTWEEFSICTEAGMNFGWPLFEGLEPLGGYSSVLVQNRDMPNPLYNGGSCQQQYFNFQDLLKQDTRQVLNNHMNPCNPGVPIPVGTPKWIHSRPNVDWKHGNQSRVGGYVGDNAVTFDLDAGNSPVSGPRFGGNAALAGPFMEGANWPTGYQNSAYHSDYASGWIKRFVYDENENLVSVHDFASGLGAITWVGAGPDGCLWYIKYSSNEVHRICFNGTVNLPPIANATQTVQYGPDPLTVNFNGSGSSDPENLPISYLWNFGNGTSTLANPQRTFTAPAGVVVSYTVTLTVTDNIGQTSTTQLLVSVNNTPPVVDITSIAQGSLYPVGVDTVYQLQAAVTDAQHGPSQLSYAWRTTLYHNNHVHPEPADPAVNTSTVISGAGCDGDNYSWRVELAVTDAGGLTGYSSRTLEPRCNAIAPTAVITTNVSAGPSPLLVVFDGSASFDPGSIVSYAWDFGDGTTSTSPTPSKTFSSGGDRHVSLMVTDNDGLTGTATKVISVITYDPPLCVGPIGSVLREYWNNVNGGSVNDLVTSPNYPNSPNGSGQLTLFTTPSEFGDNYGQRVRGYIIPPVTGTYIFTATSDDNGLVYLSQNADPAHKQLICEVPGWTNYTEYTKYPSQTSAGITLQAGIYYYVEYLHKEGGGGDFAALWWQTPLSNTRALVPAQSLAPWVNCAPSVQLRVGLQGPTTTASNLMKDDLRVANLVPFAEPYAAAGFTLVGSGGESISPTLLAVTGPDAIVDWVLIEIRNKTNPATVVATKSALLQRDGDVVSTDGRARIQFNIPTDQYYIAIRHRNHFGAMTFTPKVLGGEVAYLDFSLAQEPMYGSNARYAMPNGKMALWAGNTVQDNRLMYTGGGNDRDPILLAIGGNVATATLPGYHITDANLDGIVKYTGAQNDRDLILFNIGGMVATSIRYQQLP